MNSDSFTPPIEWSDDPPDHIIIENLSTFLFDDPQPTEWSDSAPIEIIDDGFRLEDNIILDNAVRVDDIINGDLMGNINYNNFKLEDQRDEVKFDLLHGNSIAGIGCDKDYNDIMIENIDLKTRDFQVSLDYLQQSLFIARKIAAIEIESQTLMIEEPKQYYLGDYYLGMANFKEALKIARQIGYIEKQENKP